MDRSDAECAAPVVDIARRRARKGVGSAAQFERIAVSAVYCRSHEHLSTQSAALAADSGACSGKAAIRAALAKHCDRNDDEQCLPDASRRVRSGIRAHPGDTAHHARQLTQLARC